MSNGTKIKTMKDDLLEIENKVIQSQKVPEIQQKAAPITQHSSPVSSPKPSAVFSSPRPGLHTTDPKAKDLRNIVEKLSKNGTYPQTSTSEGSELKNLIERISKREGEREKPLSVSQLATKETPSIPASIRKVEAIPVKKEPAPIKPPVIVATPVPKEMPVEKPDLDALIKPVEKPSIAPKIEKTPVKAPQNAKAETEFEEKAEEIKEILDNISKKENELKDLLDKMSKKKVSPQENAQAPAAPITPSIGLKTPAASSEKPPLEKLIKPAAEKKATLTFPEPKVPKPEIKPAQPEKPIMKKIRERMFGMEKAMPPSAQKSSISEKEAEDKSLSLSEKYESTEYFKKIAAQKAALQPNLEKVEEKFSDLPQDKQVSEMQPGKISEYETATGIIEQEQRIDHKKEEELVKARRNYLDSQYVPPHNRLVFGKQEHYSSIRKHIEERHSNANLQDLESKVAISKNIILSDKEQKKRLRERIISEYHIKSPHFLRNILATSIVIIGIVGGAMYYLVSLPPVKPPDIEIPVTPGNQVKELSGVQDFIEISTEQLKNPSTLREEASAKFSSNSNLKFFRIVIKDEKGNIVPLKDALSSIGINPIAFPQNFMEAIENEYNILAFKSSKSTVRLALAVKLKSSDTMQNAMNTWELDKVKMKDALTPLFVSDRSGEIQNAFFQSASYKNVSLRYVSLPDKNTALEYFIYKNVLAIATSKDDAFSLIDALISFK